jgi:hypothetical protein
MWRPGTQRLLVLGLVAAALISSWTGRAALALSPDSVPALPSPSGTVINVSTVAALQAAVSAVSSNQTIVIASGTYNLTSTLWVNGSKANVTIRGATNNRDDVVLVGQGMGVSSGTVPFGIWAGSGVTNLTIANLTIRNIYQHPIMLNPGTQSPRIYNVRLVDGGEQLLKANPDGSGGGVDNGIVEYSVFEYTNTAPSYYTNAVDVHTGRDWIIRHNLFRRIRAPQGQLAGPAVLMWNGSTGTVVEGNTFIDNHRDISLGLIERTPNDHTGGIIRNNFIARSPGSGGDVPIAVFDSPSTKVVHNTIWTNGQYPNAVETRFAHTTGVSVINNLSDRGLQNRDGAASSAIGNVWTAASNWFVNANGGDLHLTAAAVTTINAGVATSDAPADWDGQARPSGGAFDVGADEYAGSTAPPPDTTLPTVSVTSPQASTVAGTITLVASASDNVGVAGVWFLVDGAPVGSEDTTSPYQISWNTASVANGAHAIRAVARDAAGNSATSSPVTVSVSNNTPDTTAPSVSLTAPAAGSTVTGTLTIAASASDNIGVTSVQFTLNGVNLGASDTAAPYAIAWNTTGASNGSHVLRAVARDAAGNVTTSAARTVAVTNQTSDTTAPTVSLTTPAAGATVGGTVTISATAADNIGVTAVQFTLNGVNLGSADTTAPYAISWSTTGAANGSHALRAIARDAAGNVTSSAARTVNVSNAVAPPPSVGGCATPDPFASMGGGTCHNGGWLPPGMAPPSGGTTTPTIPPPSLPPPGTTGCSTPDPFASMGGGVCYNGGWLPPGMTPPSGGTPLPPPSPSPGPTPPPPPPANCSTTQPGAGWTCYNGGWLPPGMAAPAGTPPTPPPSSPQPPTSGCATPAPGIGWTCRDGGWLPPGYPGA